ncbi:two-component system sensor histidine kinase KdpD [Arthrobacter sp. PvP023]|uniref:sensor histidine kinase n=1 Tax=Micrococcaceae TaxID=1268 RepID=UPI001AE7C168|nr:ATP-binding protein [Arthrobacter sp. PvP023]MBP1135261.1 two-component system sensor histidine kinase KdpD [Arthrobacter sp. PvP023]
MAAVESARGGAARSGPGRSGTAGSGTAAPELQGIGRSRFVVGMVLAVVLPPGVEVLVTLAGYRNFAIIMLLHLAVAVAVAAIGGFWPAVVAAVLGTTLLNYFSADPVGTLSIADPSTLFTLLVFLAVACSVALAVGLATRRAQEAARSGAEATALSELSLRILSSDGSLETFLEKVRSRLGVDAVTLLADSSPGSSPGSPHGAGPAAGSVPGRPRSNNTSWAVLASAGTSAPVTHAAADHAVVVDSRYTLLINGGPPAGHTFSGQHQRMLAAFGAFLVAILERRQLAASMQDNQRLSEGNKMRTSILRAVSHDLRTPLAGIKLAVSSLRQEDVQFSPEDERELLATIEDSADRLDHLIGNLLDMSRITADSVNPLLRGLGWADVLPDALKGLPAARIRVELPPNLPRVEADAGMLERVVANLVENALKYAPDADVVLTARAGEGIALAGRPASEFRVVDHGAGVAPAAVLDMFQPFQRLNDSQRTGGGRTVGIGLGLAVANGFTEAMGGILAAEPTPGGGLTMVVTLPLWEGPLP